MPDLDPQAVADATKVMKAVREAEQARAEFDDALLVVASAGKDHRIAMDDYKHNRIDVRQMADAAVEFRNAEHACKEALAALIPKEVEALYLQITTPGEFAFGFGEGVDE